jgi:DNA polymerase I-like protein with 3'-5' exonuclease and polymerase domains
MATLPQDLSWIALEHRVAEILTQQEIYGWAFNERLAQELHTELSAELLDTQEEVISRFPFIPGPVFTPAKDNKTKGYVKGAAMTRLKDFNPTSRDHIAYILKTFDGWKPRKVTEKGKVQVDEVTLKDHGTDLALQFFRMLELTKQLGMLSNGQNGWLRLVRDGRIHHHCEVGAATHRCAHRNPNLAQVPSDLRFRRLFQASKGMVMVGADLSGIELRMLAHYLAAYDDGRYADILLNDDIHQVNADKIGISRKLVKTVTYAFLYGAGDEKIGRSYDPLLPPAKAKAKGAEIRQAYMDAIDGLENLVKGVKAAAKDRGWIKAIDGRQIKVDSQHKALNYLLQSSAGVVAKRWMVFTHNNMSGDLGVTGHQLAFVHDELQFECDPADSNNLGSILCTSAEAAGRFYNIRLPIAAESKIGPTWADVH